MDVGQKVRLLSYEIQRPRFFLRGSIGCESESAGRHLAEVSRSSRTAVRQCVALACSSQGSGGSAYCCSVTMESLPLRFWMGSGMSGPYMHIWRSSASEFPGEFMTCTRLSGSLGGSTGFRAVIHRYSLSVD